MIQSDEVRTRPYGGGVSELHCPRCGQANLHHTGVTVYDCDEDSATVVRTTVSGGKVSVDPEARNTGENPSSRRDGLVIDFRCEGCGDAPLKLCIAQHKGSTEIGWRYEPSEVTQDG